MDPNQQDDASAIRESPNTMVQNERCFERPPHQEPPHQERSHHERSPNERSYRERAHRERRRQDRSHHGESYNNRRNDGGVNAEVKDLKRKYDAMARQVNGDEAKLIAKEILEDTHLPFSERVMTFPMSDKFKMPRIEKYNGSGYLTEHVENFREHLILHGTPDEIACKAFPLTLARVANDWFARLLPKSVDNFKDLGYLFLAQFLATQKRNKNLACLMALC